MARELQKQFKGIALMKFEGVKKVKTLRGVLERAKALPSKAVAIARAEDLVVLKAFKRAQELMNLRGIFIGDSQKIVETMKALGIDATKVEVVEGKEDLACAELAVEFAKQGCAQMLMKGLLSTKDFLKAVVSKDKALLSKNLLSHVAVFEMPSYPKLLLVTDAAMNINPDVGQKYEILINSLKVAWGLGINKPKAAILSAVEYVTPTIASTGDAKLLCERARRDSLSATVDGPLALDIAISKEALHHKGVESAVGGEADILLVPEMVSGNILYKSLVYFAGAKVSGIVMGAKVPLLVNSRADSDESKMCSIAMGMVMA